ncbi:threonine ammonia-lyase [Marinicrinis sediminis]|uniref:threonine ammonia-lyase n=1 Tax=Marinicrinis sediminis TaxID=1652465 RepID=A0ABW5RA27_9BACL
MISIEDVRIAEQRLKGIIHTTPLDHSSTFSEFAGQQVYLKLENLQKTGSFKVRGSYNKMVSLGRDEVDKGVIAASAGNHAQGVAYSSRMLEVPCTVVMPKDAPISKIQATKRYGAKVELHGAVFDEALAYALELQEQRGATFVHPFDDEAVIAGQGTIGLEILEQLDDVDAIVCPVGGGGLIAGLALAVKERNPAIQVYGVQAVACSSMKQSLEQKKRVTVESYPTMADGIAVKTPGALNFELIQKYVDDLYCVDEMEIARTMLMLLERNKLLVEGAGASGLASLLYQKIPLKGKKVVTVLSGGNVDVNFLSRIIEHGMVEAGRYCKFTTVIQDKPGKLKRILDIIYEQQGNVQNVSHEHFGKNILPGDVQLRISLEARDQGHIDQIMTVLMERGYEIDLLK